jgi:hypothetical protein
MTPADPLVDPRDRAAVIAGLRRHAAGYTPGWRPSPGTPGAALLEVFARHLEVFGIGLNQVPGRSRLAFLDALGIGLLAARPARAPLVFELQADSPADVTVPANTRVAAQAAPPPASALPTDEAAAAPEAVVFATTQAIAATRARLAALYSLDPANDSVADHGDRLTTGFSLFDDMAGVTHALYLGHAVHFAISGAATIRLAFHLLPYPPQSLRQGLRIAWSYKAQEAWIPLDLVADGTRGLTRSGEIVLTSACGPDAVSEPIGGVESAWIQGVLETPLPPAGAGGQGRLPAVDLIQARVQFAKQDLSPDAAFQDRSPLDTSNRFRPFGARPALHLSFYLACAEAFSRGGASLSIDFSLVAAVSTAGAPQLGWQYFDGTDWSDLTGLGFEDGTLGLTQTGIVAFRCPADWGQTKVNGSEGYWLRVRIDGGDYGQPMRLELDTGTTPAAVTLVTETYDPPIVETVGVSYAYLTDPTLLDHCLAYNNGVYRDHSEDARWPRRPFEPFQPVEDLQPAIHFGFDRTLPPGLISLYLQVPPTEVTGATAGLVSPYQWAYRSENGWTELSVRDETAGFRASGLIQFVGPADARPVEGRSGTLVRVRARLKRGESAEATPVEGLWLNAAWASHREYVEGDILGTSDGGPGQSFSLLRASGSILEGEIVEVREWSGAGGDWETLAADLDPADLRPEIDAATGAVSALWVRWRVLEHLLDSGPEERHCTLERASGLLRFGDGVHGMIPPPGSRVVATYDSGGGVAGNVPTGAITELRAGVAYLQSVGNPVPAAGGAEVETLDRVAARGPQRLRHRDRAVTAEDFEWLAREASAAVYHARCLPLHGPAGFAQRGWVQVLIAPSGPEARPQPSEALKRQVLAHLAARCPAAVAGQIRVSGPEYVAVGVVCEIVPLPDADAAVVEALVRANLNAFLHPVTGGTQGLGWRFGEALYLSQAAAVIETQTEGVDYAAGLRLSLGAVMAGEVVAVGDQALIAAGDHEIRVRLGEA